MQRIITKSVLFHIGFWMVSFLILFRLFTKDYNNGTVDWIYTLLFQIPLMIIVYMNYKLIDRFIILKKILLYTLLVLLLIPLGILLHYLVFDFLAEWVFPGYYFISMFSYFEITQYILAYLIGSFLFIFAKNWFELKDVQIKLEKENHEVQLSSLKAQMNPHFLFNSLNNIYSLSTLSDELGKNYIIKLSDALRYILYRTQSDFVPLNEELDYLKNYVELEKLRLEESAEVKFNTSGQVNEYQIAPLVLLPIVENTFKHCNKDDVFIDINIHVDSQNGTLELRSSNSYNKEKEDVKEGGVGLNNARKRLDLIYPGKYTWVNDHFDNRFISELKINLL